MTDSFRGTDGRGGRGESNRSHTKACCIYEVEYIQSARRLWATQLLADSIYKIEYPQAAQQDSVYRYQISTYPFSRRQKWTTLFPSSFFPLASIWGMYHASVRDSVAFMLLRHMHQTMDALGVFSPSSAACPVQLHTIQSTHTHTCIFYISMCARIYTFLSNTQQPCCPSDRYQSVGGDECACCVCF